MDYFFGQNLLKNILIRSFTWTTSAPAIIAHDKKCFELEKVIANPVITTEKDRLFSTEICWRGEG